MSGQLDSEVVRQILDVREMIFKGCDCFLQIRCMNGLNYELLDIS